MKLVESHKFKFNKEMDDLCFRSKNLYNSCLYIIRQEFITNNNYIDFKTLYKSIKQEDIWDECNLPKKVTNQIVKLADQNCRAFFAAIKSFSKHPKKFTGRPKLPKYKDSKRGRTVVIYEKGALSKRGFKKTGLIHLSQTDIKIRTQIKDFNLIQQVRIVPKSNYFNIEVIYTKPVKELIINDNYASIDLGVNNLAAATFNDGENPFLINGRPLKSINQYFNKTKASIQSVLERKNNKKWSKKLSRLQNKRYNKITDYMHKASRLVVNQLVSKNISTLIIGRNKLWKQEIAMNKRNNQNFNTIPFYTFISMLKYKCELEGITMLETEESYTSKCSFFDNEPVKKQSEYKGKRVKRGIFKTSTKRIVNADINGSYNIMKKAISKYFLIEMDEIEGFAVTPKFLKI